MGTATDRSSDHQHDGQIDEAVIRWLNVDPVGRELRDRIRRKLRPDAEVWLILCKGGGGKTMNVGGGTNLAMMLADTLQVTVRAYADEIWYWPQRAPSGHSIIDRSLTSVGASAVPHAGYFPMQEVIEGHTKGDRLGEHLKGAMTFAAHPGNEPFKESMPDE